MGDKNSKIGAFVGTAPYRVSWSGEKIMLTDFGYLQRVIAPAIDAKYNELGGSSGILGPPTSEVNFCADRIGGFRNFQNGAVYWNPRLEAHAVYGDAYQRWAYEGYETGLGYPRNDGSDDGTARFFEFERGQEVAAIVDRPGVPTCVMRGPILTRWLLDTNLLRRARPGFEGVSVVGYPVGSVESTADGQEEICEFDNGWMVTSSGEIYVVQGDIGRAWASNGRESGFLGYPLSDEHGEPDNSECDFEGGTIQYTSEQGTIVIRRHQVWKEKFSAGHVTGDLRLEADASGDFHFTAQLYDSSDVYGDLILAAAYFNYVDGQGQGMVTGAGTILHAGKSWFDPGPRHANLDKEVTSSGWIAMNWKEAFKKGVTFKLETVGDEIEVWRNIFNAANMPFALFYRAAVSLF